MVSQLLRLDSAGLVKGLIDSALYTYFCICEIRFDSIGPVKGLIDNVLYSCLLRSWNLTFPRTMSHLVCHGALEASGEVHLQKVRDMFLGVVTALVQCKGSRPVLWQWGFTSEHTEPLRHHLTAVFTTVASLYTYMQKVSAIRCHTHALALSIEELYWQSLSPWCHCMVAGSHRGSAQNYETSVWRLGTYRKTCFDKPHPVSTPRSLPCYDKRLGFLFCVRQELSPRLIQTITITCFAITWTVAPPFAHIPKVDAIKSYVRALATAFLQLQ